MPERISPFALIEEIREWFDGPLALSGRDRNRARCARGAGAIGADFAYIGSAFIATQEANAPQGYKQMITESAARIFSTPTSLPACMAIICALGHGGGARS